MTPDIPLFFPLYDYSFSHSLNGLLSINLLAGLFFYFLFVLLGKDFIDHIFPPRSDHKPTTLYKNNRLKNLFFISLSLIIGASTHIFWDLFTHQNTAGTKTFSVLQKSYMILEQDVKGYKIAQYASSILGLLVLILFMYVKQVRHRTLNATLSSINIGSVFLILAFLIPFLGGIYFIITTTSAYIALGYFLRFSIAFEIILFFIFSFSFHLSNNLKRQ